MLSTISSGVHELYKNASKKFQLNTLTKQRIYTLRRFLESCRLCKIRKRVKRIRTGHFDKMRVLCSQGILGDLRVMQNFKKG